MLTTKDVDFTGKTVLIRVDLNVPLQNGVITSKARLKAVLPTIRKALAKGAKQLLLTSHLGRPNPHLDSGKQANFSLKPIASELAKLLNLPVSFYHKLDKDNLPLEQIVVLENVRFLVGETANNEELARKYASLADVFVCDAFASAHREHASVCGVSKYISLSCAGDLLCQEIEAIDKALTKPKRNLVAIVGGSKVSTKLTLLKTLLTKVDKLIVVGAMANTFFAARRYNIGKSLYEPKFMDEALELSTHPKIILPSDVRVDKALTNDASPIIKDINAVTDNEMILDIGDQSVLDFTPIIKQAKTIIWNGPAGAFEYVPFAQGTKDLGQVISSSKAYTLAGGGDTVAAIEQYNLDSGISYISTGGGAFLEYIEKNTLVALQYLDQSQRDNLNV